METKELREVLYLCDRIAFPTVCVEIKTPAFSRRDCICVFDMSHRITNVYFGKRH